MELDCGQLSPTAPHSPKTAGHAPRGESGGGSGGGAGGSGISKAVTLRGLGGIFWAESNCPVFLKQLSLVHPPTDPRCPGVLALRDLGRWPADGRGLNCGQKTAENGLLSLCLQS